MQRPSSVQTSRRSDDALMSPGSPTSPGSPGGRRRTPHFLSSPSSTPKLSADQPTIKVCVRVRCWIAEEKTGERGGPDVLKSCVDMPSKTMVQIKRGDEPARTFEFDRCFWSFSDSHPLYANQATLHEEVGNLLIENAMNGFNNCIFAYGQTGSGKSYSVLGGKGEHRGLLPRVVEGLFENFTQLEKGTTVKAVVAFIEIYHERLQDLLAPKDQMEEDIKLDVKQHPVFGIFVPGLTERPVQSSKEVLDLVEYGISLRKVSSTAMNATSSRSHCIFTFTTNVQRGDTVKLSKTHLVDLAGSERQKRTQAKGDRLKEGAAINQSLSTLARVISALADTKKKAAAVPFRDSKLTYMLKESLCGNSKTVMMAAISPSLADYEETLSTLNFARSVKQVQTQAKENVMSSATLEQALRQEVEALKMKVQRAQEQQQDPDQDAKLKAIMEKVRKQQEYMALLGLGSPIVSPSTATELSPHCFEEMRRIDTSRLLDDDEGSGSMEEWDGQDSDSDGVGLVMSTRSRASSGVTSPRQSRRAHLEGSVVLARHLQRSSVDAGSEDAQADAPHVSAAESQWCKREEDTGCFLKLAGPRDYGAYYVSADEISERLQELQEAAAKARASARRLGTADEMDVRGMVAVDVRDKSKVDVIVRVAAPQGGQRRERWLSGEDFESRAALLAEAARKGPSSAATDEPSAILMSPAPPVHRRASVEAQALMAQLQAVKQELHQVRCRSLIAKAELRSCGTRAMDTPSKGPHPMASERAREAHRCGVEAARQFGDALAALDRASDLVKGSAFAPGAPPSQGGRR